MPLPLILINGTPIKRPDGFTIERYNITKAGRTASGKMTMELIAKKRKFLLKYDTLSGPELQELLSVLDVKNMFLQVSYYENGTMKYATCYVGHIPSVYVRGGEVPSPLWYWKDVNFDLIEQ